MREVFVKDEEIHITGSIAILAGAASAEPGKTPPAVLSFVREWRPLGEEPNAAHFQAKSITCGRPSMAIDTTI
jgi:hypothetical protein